MIYQVQISKKAEKDLKRIYEYITFTMLSPKEASAILEKLENAIKKLNHLPKRYRLYGDGEWKEKGIRRMQMDKFAIFYHVEDSEKIVTILSVDYQGK